MMSKFKLVSAPPAKLESLANLLSLPVETTIAILQYAYPSATAFFREFLPHSPQSAGHVTLPFAEFASAPFWSGLLLGDVEQVESKSSFEAPNFGAVIQVYEGIPKLAANLQRLGLPLSFLSLQLTTQQDGGKALETKDWQSSWEARRQAPYFSRLFAQVSAQPGAELRPLIPPAVSPRPTYEWVTFLATKMRELAFNLSKLRLADAPVWSALIQASSSLPDFENRFDVHLEVGSALAQTRRGLSGRQRTNFTRQAKEQFTSALVASNFMELPLNRFYSVLVLAKAQELAFGIGNSQAHWKNLETYARSYRNWDKFELFAALGIAFGELGLKLIAKNFFSESVSLLVQVNPADADQPLFPRFRHTAKDLLTFSIADADIWQKLADKLATDPNHRCWEAHAEIAFCAFKFGLHALSQISFDRARQRLDQVDGGSAELGLSSLLLSEYSFYCGHAAKASQFLATAKNNLDPEAGPVLDIEHREGNLSFQQRIEKLQTALANNASDRSKPS